MNEIFFTLNSLNRQQTLTFFQSSSFLCVYPSFRFLQDFTILLFYYFFYTKLHLKEIFLKKKRKKKERKTKIHSHSTSFIKKFRDFLSFFDDCFLSINNFFFGDFSKDPKKSLFFDHEYIFFYLYHVFFLFLLQVNNFFNKYLILALPLNHSLVAQVAPSLISSNSLVTFTWNFTKKFSSTFHMHLLVFKAERKRFQCLRIPQLTNSN